MPRFLSVALKAITIIFIPIAFLGFAISTQAISGDQYVAILEILGTDSKPGSIEIFGVNPATIVTLLDFLEIWSLPLLVAFAGLGVVSLIFSQDKIRASFQICSGLFVSFGIWTIFLTKSTQAFSQIIGKDLSDFSALVMATFLSEFSAKLMNVTGLLSLLFASLALGFWLTSNRGKVQL